MDQSQPEDALVARTGATLSAGVPKLLTRWLGPAVVLILALAIGALVVRLAPGLQRLATYGYAGVFLLMVVSGGSILLPVPGLAGVATAGMLWDPLFVGLAAGLGNATGEFTGYAAGLSGRTLLAATDRPFWRKTESWLRRYGTPALIVFAAIPNPLFDVVGVVAGCLRFPAWKFWVACAVGNTIKYTAIAFLGATAATLLS